jgi:hypothetical protein
MKVAKMPPQLDPIDLRSFSEWTDDGKMKGKSLDFDRTAPGVLALARDVEKINAFWDDHELQGGTHRGFTRIFHKPAVPDGKVDYGWNIGGRLYSTGEGSYQTMGKDDRLRMTIDGEPVVELDVQASHLTIFQAQQGNPLDVYSGEDPYSLTALDTGEVFPREVVKAYIAACFGKGQPLGKRWGQKAARDWQETRGSRLEDDYPLHRVAKTVHLTYPALAALNEPCTWGRLQYVESLAIVRTVLDLADQNIPVLPVHDSIIAPASKVAPARDALRSSYYVTIRADPHIVSTRPQSAKAA